VADFLLGGLCGGLIVLVLALTYVCGDERGFLSGTNLNRLLREYERMRREPANQGGDQRWWEDG
jgi:hypothetical protein